MKAVIDDPMIGKAGGREPCDISYKAAGTMTFNMGSEGSDDDGQWNIDYNKLCLKWK